MTKIKFNKSTTQHKSSRKDHRQEGEAIVRQETKKRDKDQVMILTVTVAVDLSFLSYQLSRNFIFSQSSKIEYIVNAKS
jgi:hypothetical protein